MTVVHPRWVSLATCKFVLYLVGLGGYVYSPEQIEYADELYKKYILNSNGF